MSTTGPVYIFEKTVLALGRYSRLMKSWDGLPKPDTAWTQNLKCLDPKALKRNLSSECIAHTDGMLPVMLLG